MPWIVLTSDDVLSEFTPNEAASIRNMQGSGSGSGPPFTNIDVITARTIDEVRGFIMAGDYAIDETADDTLPKGLFADAIAIARWRTLIAAPQLRQLQTEERKKAFDDALAKLNKIADQQFNVEPPEPPVVTFQAGTWNSENKLIMRTHPVVKPGPQGADDYANPNAPQDGAPSSEPPAVATQSWRLLTITGPPAGVTMQVKNASGIWEDVWTYVASS